MKKLLIAFLTVFVVACSTGGLRSKSENDLLDSFENLSTAFDTTFDEHGQVSSLKLTSDSLLLYFNTILEVYPESKNLPALYFCLGEVNMKIQDGLKAVEYFEALEEKFPEYIEVPKSIYLKGYTYEIIINDVEKAKESYKHLYKNYPDAKWAQNAKNQVLYLNLSDSIK